VIRIAQEAFVHSTPQAIDFAYLAELLRAVADNLSGLETTEKEEIGQPLLGGLGSIDSRIARTRSLFDR